MQDPDHYRPLIRPLLAGLAALLLAVVFILLADEVTEGDTRGFDTSLLYAAQALRADHPWVAEVMRDLSGLGSTVVLTVFTVAACGYLALVGARMVSALVAMSILSAAALVSLFKTLFGQLRPGAAFAEFLASGLSFPSGHASMSAVVFLTFGALLASRHSRPRERWYILGAATGLTLLVGLSRVALGVHWASDVLGGWAFGTAWAVMWLLVARHLAGR
ncbi:phosphatase PAP2 family protein [Variovorax terrae]|uniref:Phosphatase PAP2 family protein n=1 Tax=Variovorax terrae TaxID=2923278 RepID=A0A9X1VXY8_9BURK|nr:phosphatase PAP2 family protein [Variovorax terrae]MCJ0764964.1 phosphatase PAP2 family protein [Variovorax terrae]